MQLIPLSGTAGAFVPWENAAKATVAQINATGGVAGRQLQLIVCDTGTIPQTAACGQQAVSDKVVGIVSISASAAYEPYVEPAHIATINQMRDPVEYSASNSFNLTAGTPGIAAGMGAFAKALGCKNAVLMAVGAAYSKSIVTGFEQVARGAGVKAGLVTIPEGVPDMSPFVANAFRQGADCLVLNALGADFIPLFRAVQSSGHTATLLTSTGFLAPATIQSLGSAVTTLHVVSNLLPASDMSNPAVAQWVQTINKYSPSPKEYDANSAVTWASVKLLAYAAAHVKTITASSILQFLDHLSNYDLGVGPSVSFDTPPPSNPLGPRMFQQYALPTAFSPGASLPHVTSTHWFNIFTGKSGPSVG
jgi:branched-chain amino acid transport system substrate-binding protein